MQKLFTEFNSTTAQQWKEQLIKDLKGIDFEELVWKTNSEATRLKQNRVPRSEDNRRNPGNFRIQYNSRIIVEYRLQSVQ